jgi:GNAT superfamily N-acetyltransferase
MAILIRMADLNDLEQLIQIRYDYFAAENWEVTASMKIKINSELKQYYTDHLNRDFFAAVADDNGIFAASAFLAINCVPANPFWPTGKNGVILNVLTKPDYRRKGLASQVMQRLIEEAKQQNLSCLELSASKMGRPLYEKLGFQVKDLSHSTEMVLDINR